MYRCETVNAEQVTMPSVEEYLCYAEDFHRMGVFGQGIKVGIVDSGVDLLDLATNNAVGDAVSLVPGDATVMDQIGHGSLVAKIILTIAPQVELVPIRIFGSEGTCEDYVAGKGLQESALRADITNASIGGPDHSEIQKAIQMHRERGIPLVAAAGNGGDGKAETPEYDYPAAHEYATSIGAVDMGIAEMLGLTGPLLPSYYSDSNKGVDAVARGKIPGTWKEGTSFAAPVVTALLALFMSWARLTGRPHDDPACYAWLLGHARQLPGLPARNDQTGYGFVTLRPYQERHTLVVNAGTGMATIDGKTHTWKEAPINKDGHLMFWGREWADLLQLPVKYDEKKNEATFGN